MSLLHSLARLPLYSFVSYENTEMFKYLHRNVQTFSQKCSNCLVQIVLSVCFFFFLFKRHHINVQTIFFIFFPILFELSPIVLSIVVQMKTQKCSNDNTERFNSDILLIVVSSNTLYALINNKNDYS